MNAVAITISNDIPSPELEIVSLTLVTRHQSLLAQVNNLPAITSPDSAAAAEVVLMDLSEIEKQIQAEVDRRSKPAHQLHKAIIAVGNKALEPVQQARASLRGRIGAWNREQQRLRDEALAKAEAERKAAEAAAEKERQRLQAEADAKHAAEVAAAEAVRKKAQDDANAAAEAERARLQAIADQEAKELAEVLGSAPVVEAVKVAPVVVAAPVVSAPVVVKVEIAAPVTVVPEMVKSSVVTKKVWKMEITEPEAIPAYSCGRELRKIDKVALRALLDEGIVMQGARLVEDTQDAMRGVRS
jgi:flagellar biosynthesis GTPase FlhF